MPRSATITGDAAQVKALLKWSRSEGIELSNITVGACSVVVARPQAPAVAPGKPAPPEHRPSLYERYAPGVMADVLSGLGDDEYAPAIRSK